MCTPYDLYKDFPEKNTKKVNNHVITLWWLRLSIILCICLFIVACTLSVLTTSLTNTQYRELIVDKKIIENAKIITWTCRLGLCSKSTKKSQNTNGKSNISMANSSKQFNNTHVSSGKYIVCYYTISGKLNTSQELNPSHIDPHICTHIIVGFAEVVNCTLFLNNYLNIYLNVLNLKKQAPQLKIMISAGGISELPNTGFPEMVKTHKNRKIFIRSVLNIINKYNFDGLDIDWEFPTYSDSIKREKIFFVQLLQETKHAFDKSGKKLILSAAVAAPVSIVDTSYNIPNIADHVDFINLMTYDFNFYHSYLPITGHNAPLYNSSKDLDVFATLNVNYSALYWLEGGMTRDKIVIGIPTYGHSFRLVNSDNHGVHAPAKGIGHKGDQGFVNYPTTCEFIRNGGNRVFDNETKTPYVYKSNEWISFDDTTSIKKKIEWIKDNDFKGAMIFSMNTDDWNASCDGRTTFPLIKTVKNMLGN
ncbi:hypothetical protein HCN44_006252 [Aphidius gifuensis]|uniref:GH18 domain-containing protein n=1 Tax=Aphidius gifuensis TaxID=684658 RepID=A0A834XVA9_APHGI|nr:acidic mammalian chitinase-like [Aphidius gifuensis]XP_044007607.1 acidic mammalian chitinase-like [Aphidius gifuensis]XP_044007608.1 acidic mammalian chitinase-like [Aphidius gifuensis]XP_044007609.1 acidic mammalian chitinase-like [Aphidius gifuensis]KAF7993192.1 hypothetical protein HCN44_006252 [Aphidius gifuensis]